MVIVILGLFIISIMFNIWLYWKNDIKIITHYLNNLLPVRFPNLMALAVDKTGVGNGIVDFIDYNVPHTIYDIVFSQPMKVDLVENTINNLESKFVTYYPQEILKKEMDEYSREKTEQGRTIYVKGESDDFVDSFNLCNMAITKFLQDGPKKQTPFFVDNMNDSLNNKSYRQKVRNRRWR